MATYYVPADSDIVAIDSDWITIEGADLNRPKLTNRPIHINDYLGIGTELRKR